ncbi:sigma-70 family RNA polymerase sigma factor [Pseudoalteromonas sp. MMG022]|uniref:sigma-70 family RNA polymerase sigma factor n=1 Tax=Pseudoalteromonas sp. MMG022 TaxID=2909978 RepID=UPI001F029DE6|nr:sigma-70 family RNA polymerase sigma factor [Pseudoalteromonas sp. MMG022]MCF6436973.1 sigma-70 family RNA polymerase sigma factor [Pseudoalteromonas sp. MMG022]
MWSQWKADRCESAKHFLYEKYQQWAEVEASCWQKRLCNVSADREDFYQYAQVGLLEAMNSFELDKGVMFKSYAQYRIRGSIFNNVFRFSDNCAYKNKLYYKSNEGMDIDSLIDSKGLVGAIEELALEYLLESDLEEARQHSLSGCYYSSDEMFRLKRSCMSALSRLEEPQGTILSLHYRFEKNLTEIAEILGLSLGRVSQLRKLAINELTQMLEQK